MNERSALEPAALIRRFPGPALLADAAAGVVEISPAGRDLAGLLESGEASDLTLAIFACSSDLVPRQMKLDRGRDAQRICLELSLLPSIEGDDRVVLVFGRDVTVERKLTEALVASRRLFKDIEAVSSDFGWETDTQGRFTYVSVRGALGYGAHELDGTSARRFAPQPSTPPEPWPFESAAKIDCAEHWLNRKDGAQACIELSSRPVLDDSGRWIGVRGVARDITERKTIEAARARAEAEAIAANDAKSRFLAIMSHELRTPINGVIGNLELLKTTLIDNDQGEMIHATELAAESLLRIIGDILDFSKIEAGKIELERLAYEPARLVDEVVSLLNPSAVAKGIVLEGLVYPSTPAKAVLDPFRVRQVLMNLVGNALKFTESGGVFVSMSGQTGPDGRAWLSVAVEDTGIGFDAETVDLFAPFKQADGSTTRRFGGSGLGLSICRGLLERMGGMIGADSRTNEGATFWFALPVDEAEKRKSPLDVLKGHRIAILAADLAPWNEAAAALRAAGLAAEINPSGDLKDCLAIITDQPELGRRDFGAARRILARADDNLRARRSAHAQGFSQVIGLPPDHDIMLSNLAALACEELPALTSARPIQIDDAAGLRALFDGRKVLALEDNAMSRNVIKRQFTTLGVGLEIRENGRQGLEALDESEFALVLTDCAMPEIDGYLFTQILRRRELGSGRRLPVIAMTANAADDDARKCLSAGMDDYLAKPVRLAQLAKTLRAWGGGEPREVLEARREATAAPIDLALLSEILGDAERASADDALKFFAEVFPDLLQAADAAVAAGDLEAMADAAHSAKGAARNAAALDLGAALGDAERLAQSGDAPGFITALERGRTEWGNVRLFISSRIGD